MGPTSHLPELAPDVLPENTLASFEQAILEGAEGLEFDVAVSADGVVVVIHDDELNRNVAGADREGNDLGRVGDHDFVDLKNLDVGNGHYIPSLHEVLDMVSDYNFSRETPLIINIELKGDDCVERTYETIMEYVERGDLRKEDFVFNTFKWERLQQMRELDPEVKLVPNIKTSVLFGSDNVEMPGFFVAPELPCDEAGLAQIQWLHDEIGCHAFDCVVYDIRPELADLCARNGIGLYASPSSCREGITDISPYVQGFLTFGRDLPALYLKADDAAETVRLVDHLLAQDVALQAPQFTL